MTQAVLINLGSGNLNSGFPGVTVQLWVSGYSRPQQFVGSLPAFPILIELYRQWKSIYNNLCSRIIDFNEFRRHPQTVYTEIDDELEIETEGITNISQVSFEEVCQLIEDNLNAWLNTSSFICIDRQLRSLLDKESEIQVTLETNDSLLRRLPWHCWQFFDDYPKSELALSQPEYIRLPQKQQETDKVRILAVLGSTQGIDLAAEQQFLENLERTHTKFLTNPSQEELNQELLDPNGWEIFFFAGHSQTEGETGRIYINENQTNNSLTIKQLKASLRIAIANGLKLAIFNSCDGLGLANTLEKLYIPTTIIMREPVPNKVAQEFFKHFLMSFAIRDLSLHASVRRAREQLRIIEGNFPGASWLPAICQNPAIEPPRWSNIAKPVRLVLSSEQIYSLEKILANFIGPIAPTLLKTALTCASNFDDLVENLLVHLSPQKRIQFQQEVDLLLVQPEVISTEEKDETLNREFICKCERYLIEAVGPIAPILIQQALNSDNMNPRRFVEALTVSIADSKIREKFQQQVFDETS